MIQPAQPPASLHVCGPRPPLGCITSPRFKASDNSSPKVEMHPLPHRPLEICKIRSNPGRHQQRCLPLNTTSDGPPSLKELLCQFCPFNLLCIASRVTTHSWRECHARLPASTNHIPATLPHPLLSMIIAQLPPLLGRLPALPFPCCAMCKTRRHTSSRGTD